MDLKKIIIIVDDKLVTKDISYYKYDNLNNMYTIKYKNNSKYYTYSKLRATVLTSYRIVDLRMFSLLKYGALLENIKEAYEFEDQEAYYYRIFFYDNSFCDYSDDVIKKVKKSNCNVLDYLKRASEITSVNTDDGKKILCEQMEKVKLDDLNNVLANYIGLSHDISKEIGDECLIFPFGCNYSQYKAVEKAIYNKASVIEGPPGTGKTQTILNIIANIIIRGMNCQVVSNNNAAIENIEEKLKKYELDFFEALLGKNENKESFLLNQKEINYDFSNYEKIDIGEITKLLNEHSDIVRKIYKTKNEIARLIQRKSEMTLEYNYFKKYIQEQDLNIIALKGTNLSKIKLMWAEILCVEKISFWNKLKYIFLYGLGDFKFFSNDIEIITSSVQDVIYRLELEKIEEDIYTLEKFVSDNKNKENDFIKLSMDYFVKYLSIRYKDSSNNKRKNYSDSDIWKNCESFVKDYPVILSTTYSSRNTFKSDFRFDYIIMDEASQIDIVTGTLALSSAKYAVVIGDEKQLPNVVTDKTKKKLDKLFDEYSLDKGYSYSLNSFLTSIKNTIKDIPVTLLREHYRCHPKIINFCNKKFYNNQLVIMTKDNGENDVIKVIRTVKGNHVRDKASQRQVDILKNILPELKSDDIGIIAPYNNQVKLIRENIDNIDVSTVHKFQGREKDIILMSTVDDDITDFVANSNILNVSISRAKKQLIFIVTGNPIKNRNIKDIIDYVDYNNMEVSNSKINSIYDLLYKQYELERLIFYKKHNKVSKFDSENFTYYLIEEIIKGYDGVNFVFGQPLKILLRDKSLLTDKEMQFANHPNTHLDFCIFNEVTKQPILAIEVDGYRNHKIGTKQYDRDLLKNDILKKYSIPIIRLKTNGSQEGKIIRDALDKIIKS